MTQTLPIPQDNTVFLPLQQLSDEEYSSIRLRGMTNQWPTQVYDNGNYPLRTLSFWPVPTTRQGVELWLWEPLNVYASLDEELNLPQGYERYLKFALAVELAAEFGKEVPPIVLAGLQEAEQNLKRMNQKTPIKKPSSLMKNVSNQDHHWNYLDMIMGAGVPRRIE